MKVAIIDYGMCNLGSVRRAFEECGADATIIDDPQLLREAEKIVLPGVGAFAQGMHNLRVRGWEEALRSEVLKEKKPLLGICLGMQLLADVGVEGGQTCGLGFIAGSVERLVPTQNSERIPHVGWNEIHIKRVHPLTDDIPSGTDFYFVHSFHFKLSKESDLIAETPYCGRFASVVAKENIMGAQFHPEKSQKPGFQLIKNFLRLTC